MRAPANVRLGCAFCDNPRAYSPHPHPLIGLPWRRLFDAVAPGGTSFLGGPTWSWEWRDCLPVLRCPDCQNVQGALFEATS